MNQTVTINISGIVFHIEVDAYEKLKQYLNKIKSYFNNSEECEEIMTDIEARVAELFNSKITDANQVIMSKDVDAVIEVMGKPEQFVDHEQEQEQVYEKEYSQSNQSKKFFRDPDERVLGGVCSGVSAYFGFDRIWLRLLFVMTTLFLGFGPLIYIILWIVIPEAKTASDKLQMKGEPINVDNIGKKVEEEAAKVNEKIKSVNSTRLGESLENFFANVFSVIVTLFKAASKLIGIGMILLGLFLGVWFAVGLFDDSILLSYSSSGLSTLEGSELLELLFSSDEKFTWFLIAAVVVIGIPIIGLIIGGAKMVFNLKTNSGVGISMAILWFIAIFAVVTIGITTAAEQKSSERLSKVQGVKGDYANYVLKLSDQSMPSDIMFEADDFSVALAGDQFYCNEIDLDIVESEVDSIEIELIYVAHGRTKKDALQRAERLNYQFNQQDSVIAFDSFWSTAKDLRLRGQHVKIEVRLPKGKSVYLDPSLDWVLNDIENVTDTWDHNMLDKFWVMLEEGLTCLDCEDIEGVQSNQLDSVLLSGTVIE